MGSSVLYLAPHFPVSLMERSSWQTFSALNSFPGDTGGTANSMWSCMTHVVQPAGRGDQNDFKLVTPDQTQKMPHLKFFLPHLDSSSPWSLCIHLHIATFLCELAELCSGRPV